MSNEDMGSKPLSDKACFTDKTLKPPVAKGSVGDHRKPCPSVLASEGYKENTSGPGQCRFCEKVSNSTDNVNEASESCCFTETLAAGPLNRVCVGVGEEIVRWEQGSVIEYIVRAETFPKEHATHVAKSFDDAAEGWNEKLDGVGPRFKRTHISEAAVCEVVYKVKADDSKRDTLASAFFPGSEDPVVYVYPKALEDGFRDCMVNVFYHELGHVLGLRHEFALEREKHYHSVVVGQRNKLSVMNYFPHPNQLQIHDLDVELVKELYNLKESSYNGLPITDKVPQPLNSRRRVSSQAKLAGPRLGMVAVGVGVVMGVGMGVGAVAVIALVMSNQLRAD